MVRPILSLITAGALLTSAAELPVQEVILYKNGVGYFARTGEIRSGESARLDFKAEEMNDVLKSLSVLDLSGNSVTGIRYDSAEPLEKKLEGYPFRLNDSQSLSALLDQLKGAEIIANNEPGIIAGSRIAKGEEGAEIEKLTLLKADGEIRSLDLAAVTSLKFTDPVLQKQFKDYLLALNTSRAKDKKSVYIDSANDKGRNLRVSYLVPTPIWKSSYRLILNGADATLEGWAIVDNTTGEDWNQVKLALVSGRPVSFQSQMYAPRYIQRPFAELAENQPVAPQVYEGAIAARGRMTPLAGLAGGGGVMGGVIGSIPKAAPAPPVAQQEMALKAYRAAADASSSVRVDSTGQDVGELFEYRFNTPITIKKNESAMVPFLQQKTTARKLLIWTSGLNPRNAAEVSNTTGKTLDGGPITVFDSGSYGGEALMETVKQGDKRLISYAVDQGTRITTNLESGEETVREVKLNRGVLTSKISQRQTTTYTIKNADTKAKTLMIEHPLNEQSKIIGTQPVETTSSARRFEVALKPNTTETLQVVEETVLDQTDAISNYTPEQILTFIQSRNLNEKGRAALQQIADKKRSVDGARQELADIDRQLKDRSDDQTRLRENIRSLGNVAGQQESVQRYSQQLAEGEVQITGLRDRQGVLRKQITQLQTELNRLIENLSF